MKRSPQTKSESPAMEHHKRERMAMWTEELSKAGPTAQAAAENLLRLLRSRRPANLNSLVASADAAITAWSSLRGAACNLLRDQETMP